MINSNTEINIFFSYAHKDESYREQLEEHLAIFKRQGLIQGWSDRKITAGDDWKSAIDTSLQSADLILLLISSSFIASDYCYSTELSTALARHESGDAYVIPIFIRPVEFQDAPFAKIQGLPKDAKPVSMWDDADLAWKDIASGIKLSVAKIREKKQRPSSIDRMQTIQEAMNAHVENLDRLYNSKEQECLGMQTSFIELDRLTNGLKAGDLFILGSRPSMGKTNFSLTIAKTIALSGLPVIIFSTTLQAHDVSKRLLSLAGNINYRNTEFGTMDDSDWPKFTRAIQLLVDTTVLIDDSPTLSIEEIRARCLREKIKFGALPFILIDSLQYIILEKNSLTLGRSLKLLARELDTAILLTSQVPREIETRINKRPFLSDLSKSGDLTDDADTVAFLYRDSFYNYDSLEKNITELIVAKNRSGPIGTIRLLHDLEKGSFTSFVHP